MPTRYSLWLLFFTPLVVMAGLYTLGLTIPVPHFGRDYVIRLTLPAAGEAIDLPDVAGPQDASRPLVVIDAGHGGHDPGASGQDYKEKQLTLGLAQALRDQLVREGGIRVALTRDDDRYLVLQERFDVARRLGANLFISIHADSAGEEADVQGASVYTLSDEASDEASARYAARENQADKVNGVQLADQSDVVSAILIELSQRRTQEQSAEFAGLITREGEGTLTFRRDPRRSAAFAVLRAPDVPSVLFEAGYITNSQDARRLASPEGRARFAETLGQAIRIYFARNAGG